MRREDAEALLSGMEQVGWNDGFNQGVEKENTRIQNLVDERIEELTTGVCREAGRPHNAEDFPYDVDEWERKSCGCLSDIPCKNGCGVSLGHGTYMRMLALSNIVTISKSEKSSKKVVGNNV